jgi:hypothetical protein
VEVYGRSGLVYAEHVCSGHETADLSGKDISLYVKVLQCKDEVRYVVVTTCYCDCRRVHWQFQIWIPQSALLRWLASRTKVQTWTLTNILMLACNFHFHFKFSIHHFCPLNFSNLPLPHVLLASSWLFCSLFHSFHMTH